MIGDRSQIPTTLGRLRARRRACFLRTPDAREPWHSWKAILSQAYVRSCYRRSRYSAIACLINLFLALSPNARATLSQIKQIFSDGEYFGLQQIWNIFTITNAL